MTSDRWIVPAPQCGNEREWPELILLHDDRWVASVLFSGTRKFLIVVAPVARRFQMVLDMIIKTEIAVLAPGIVDRMGMHLVRLIGIDETMLNAPRPVLTCF